LRGGRDLLLSPITYSPSVRFGPTTGLPSLFIIRRAIIANYAKFLATCIWTHNYTKAIFFLEFTSTLFFFRNAFRSFGSLILSHSVPPLLTLRAFVTSFLRMGLRQIPFFLLSCWRFLSLPPSKRSLFPHFFFHHFMCAGVAFRPFCPNDPLPA